MPSISISTREDSNNRSMVQPSARLESGLTLRPISLGSLEILRQLGNGLGEGGFQLRAHLIIVEIKVAEDQSTLFFHSLCNRINNGLSVCRNGVADVVGKRAFFVVCTKD